MKTAFIFPAFISEYIGNETHILETFTSNFNLYLQEASKITADDFEQFSQEDPAYTEDELRSQIISYIFSSIAMKNRLLFVMYVAHMINAIND